MHICLILATLLVILEQQTVLYLPDGTRVDVPAGTEFEVCGDPLQEYDLDGMAIRYPQSCPERKLFADGFE